MDFMVHFQFRPEDQADTAPLVAKERARITELQEQGIVKALYLSTDMLHAWIVLHGESQEQVQQSLESLPLYPHAQVTVTKLL